MNNKREPLLSDDDAMYVGGSAARGKFLGPMDVAINVRDYYEAARTKDADLIQQLVDALGRWYGDKKGDDALAHAEAAGFKPTKK